MWIEWKYNDQGHGDFKPLEVPIETYNGKTYYGGEESVEEYICEMGLVPTWSERFMGSRIEWRKIEAPSKEFLEAKINLANSNIRYHKLKIKEYKNILKNIDKQPNLK